LRLSWIDIAKGLGIFLVILGHLITIGSPIFKWIGSFHMPLFFFLSGLVFNYNNNLLNSLKTIFARLILPYILIIVIIYLLISLLIPPWHPKSIIITLFEVFYTGIPYSLHAAHLWFLICLASVQILFIIIKKLKLTKEKEYLIIVISVMFSLSIGFVYTHYLNKFCLFKLYLIPRLPFNIETALMALFFFYLGHELKEQKIIVMFNNIKVSIKLVVVIVSLSANVILGTILNGDVSLAHNNYQNPVLYLVSAVCGITFIVGVSNIINRSFILEFYGKYSLPIYLFHIYFIYLFAFLLSTFLGKKMMFMINIPLVYCFVGLIFVLVLSLPIPRLYKNSIGVISNKCLK